MMSHPSSEQKKKKRESLSGSMSSQAGPDTRLPKLRADGQGPYLRSLDHLGRSSEVREIKSLKVIKCD